MEQSTATPFFPTTVAGGNIEYPECTRHHVRVERHRPEPHDEQPGCDLAEVLEQAIALGRNRAAGRDIRLHAFIVDDLCVAEDQHAVLRSLDAMLAMATGMAAWGSLIVCEAMSERDQVVVRLRFAGEPAGCQTNGLTILDCDLRREWPTIPPRH